MVCLRGALAPLFHSFPLKREAKGGYTKRELKRGGASLIQPIPPPLSREGDTGDRVT